MLLIKHSAHKELSESEAKSIGDSIGINWQKVDLKQFRMGLMVEMEHGEHDSETNVTNGDMKMTGKIAWAHLKEMPDYYTRLKKMESDAKLENSRSKDSVMKCEEVV